MEGRLLPCYLSKRASPSSHFPPGLFSELQPDRLSRKAKKHPQLSLKSISTGKIDFSLVCNWFNPSTFGSREKSTERSAQWKQSSV